MRKIVCLAAFLAVLSTRGIAAQEQDPEALKKAILDKVRARLEAERARILKRVEQIIDEELRAKKDDPSLPSDAEKKIRELERRLKILEEQREELLHEIGKTKRLAADEDLRKEAKKSGPQSEEEAQALFDEALKDHEAKKFDDSVRKFKMIYYNYPKEVVGVISAYNVACGYALAGKKDHALDWLEISIAGGYRDYEHMRKDTDLDSLRKERRYKKLLADQ